MAGDLNKPALTDTYANVLAEIRDNFADQAKAFDGTSTANIPAKAKRLVWSTGKFEQYNGSTWDTLALNGMTIGITTPAAAKFTTLTTTGNSALGDAEATDAHSIKGATTVLANSADAALKITQTGSGNALVVEDSANPDATPFVIDGAGRTYIGVNPGVVPGVGYINNLVVAGQDNNIAGMSIFDYASASTPRLTFLYSPSGTVGTQASVSNGTALGEFRFLGSDGTNFIRAAAIAAQVDGTPGTNDMPGRLVFSTTADGGSTPIERMRLDSAGQVLVTGYLRSTTDVRANGCLMQTTSPVNSNVSATLAASTLVSGIATGTPAAGINFTLPTGTNLDAVFNALQNNQTFEWSVINLAAATHAITLLPNTNHTVVGNMVVNANSSGRFATRKTSSDTFITYRLA